MIDGHESSDLTCSTPVIISATHAAPTDNESVLRVVVGTSKMAAEDVSLAKQIADVAQRANGHQRFSVAEVRGRLAKGDAGSNANRVLHVAFLGDAVVGCCSSTVQTGWTPHGCGHWGALAVDPSAQGTGVGAALVDAAEERLLAQGCKRVQIEYHYYRGEAESERLKAWYEDRLGFSGSGQGWRCVSKTLSAAAIKARRHKRASRPLIDPVQPQNDLQRDSGIGKDDNGAKEGNEKISNFGTDLREVKGTGGKCDKNARQVKEKLPVCSRCCIL